MSQEVNRIRKLYLEFKGLDPLNVREWGAKFNALKGNARFNRGVGCFLTFDQYIDKVVEAGIKHPSEIGRGLDKYQMGRIGDVGDYRFDICRFITQRQNLQEEIDNGGTDSAAIKLKGRTKESHQYIADKAQRQKGRTKYNDPSVLAMAEKKSGRRKDTHEDILRMSKSKSKRFRLVAPDGSIHEGLNLKEFCDDNDLAQSAMSKVCRGEARQYKGWTGTYVQKDES